MTKSDEASIVRSLRRIAKALESMQIDEYTEIIHCEDCIYFMPPHACTHEDGVATAQTEGFCNYAVGKEEWMTQSAGKRQ